MKRYIVAIAAAFLMAGTLPATAADSLNVPLVASAPSANAFPNGAVASLDWNATDNTRSDEPSTAHVVSDGKYLYVKFDVSQREPMIGSAGGDNVAVDLWPNGQSGEQYRLGVGIDGTHTADSTANTAAWDATTSSHAGGYTVAMRIPMSAVQGSGTQVQFERWIASDGNLAVWAHGAAGTAVAAAGSLTFAASVGAVSP